MKKKVFCIAILFVCLSGTVTFGITPVGQPAASLRDHWLGLGIDYSHTEIDLKAENIKNVTLFKESTIKDLKIEYLFNKSL